MSALDQPRPKPLIVRIGPRKKIEEALRQDLIARDVKISADNSLSVSSPTLSSLEAYFWRDIQYFLQQEYTEYKAVEMALERVRKNPHFVETLNKLVEEFRKGDMQNG